MGAARRLRASWRPRAVRRRDRALSAHRAPAGTGVRRSPAAGRTRVVLAVCGVAALFWLCVAPPWVVRALADARAMSRWPSSGGSCCSARGSRWCELQARSPWLVLAAMAIVWIADTAAYFAGRAFGRRKLAPQVSPGKTWEGVVRRAGWRSRIYALALVPLRARGRVRPPARRASAIAAWIAFALLLASVSVVGDLFESLLKRQAGVKDSGSAAARPRRRARSHRRAARGDAARRRSPRNAFCASASMRSARIAPRRDRHRSAIRRSMSSRAIRIASTSPRSAAQHATATSSRRCAGASGRRFAALLDRDAARALPRALRARGSADPRARRAAKASSEAAALPEVDTVLAAIVGAAGLAPTLAAARARQAHPAREQGSARHGRRAVHAHASRRAARRCCRSTASTTRSSSACPPAYARDPGRRGRAAHSAHRVGRPVSRRARWPISPRDARRGLRASELVDGPQDLGRFGDDDEQGPRSDRGALAVRRARARRSRSSSIRRASSIRWSNTSTARCSRSSAIPTCARRSRRRSRIPSASTPGVAPLDLAQLGVARLRRAGPRALSLPAPRVRGAGGGRHGAGDRSTPPTKSRSRRFSPGAARFTDIAAACADTLARLPSRPVASLEDALAADADARRTAARWLGPAAENAKIRA